MLNCCSQFLTLNFPGRRLSSQTGTLSIFTPHAKKSPSTSIPHHCRSSSSAAAPPPLIPPLEGTKPPTVFLLKFCCNDRPGITLDSNIQDDDDEMVEGENVTSTIVDVDDLNFFYRLIGAGIRVGPRLPRTGQVWG
ncbi:hypothetical protein Droror1_Dr00016230 [Drosera rotundifolia]